MAKSHPSGRLHLATGNITLQIVHVQFILYIDGKTDICDCQTNIIMVKWETLIAI
jgi:hypothetical protein